jgi:hypothetical protein
MISNCFVCGKESKIVKHHITYNPEKIILVCESCHDLIHRTELHNELKPVKGESKEFYKNQRSKFKQINLQCSVLENLRKIGDEKGYPSYCKVIRYLVEHWEESYKLGEVKEK